MLTVLTACSENPVPGRSTTLLTGLFSLLLKVEKAEVRGSVVSLAEGKICLCQSGGGTLKSSV